jgi:hypothetical protein
MRQPGDNDEHENRSAEFTENNIERKKENNQ